MEKDASKLVSSAILGLDGETVIVNGKAYYIPPPTIKRLMGVGYYLSDMEDVNVGNHIFHADNATKALSYFVTGDESLNDELKEGTMKEITDALETALKLIDVSNFIRLSALARNVKRLIAKQK